MIDDFHGGYALILFVNDGASQHITGNHIQYIAAFLAQSLHIAGHSGYTADRATVLHFGEEVAVYVICVQYRKLF